MIDVNFAREKKKPREKTSSDTYRCVDGVKISKKKIRERYGIMQIGSM